MTDIFVLLIIFQLKHLVADYYLQFPYMYINKGADENWLEPLTHHAIIHAAFAMIISVIYLAGFREAEMPYGVVISAMVGMFDFSTHFVTDRWKAIKKDGPDTSKFWYSLGIDQMVHHIVGIIIVYWITQG